jgi:hypothetical protein
MTPTRRLRTVPPYTSFPQATPIAAHFMARHQACIRASSNQRDFTRAESAHSRVTSITIDYCLSTRDARFSSFTIKWDTSRRVIISGPPLPRLPWQLGLAANGNLEHLCATTNPKWAEGFVMRSRIIFLGLICALLPACGDEKKIEPSVKVYKDLGSVQCGDGSGSITPPETMKKDLLKAGIMVRSFSCGLDGLVRLPMCGLPDGKINIFEIPNNKLGQAQALGFKDLRSLPSPKEVQCP